MEFFCREIVTAEVHSPRSAKPKKKKNNTEQSQESVREGEIPAIKTKKKKKVTSPRDEVNIMFRLRFLLCKILI